NREQGTGNREQGTGNREQVLSNFTFPYLCRFFRSPTYQLPITHYPLPITHYPLPIKLYRGIVTLNIVP
ncbi:hypothetical protein PN463_15900, partial [Dolichospermum circinale CS-537/03]|nr:hypothetical protein [Dolichospermum circinale CS-537/03]